MKSKNENLKNKHFKCFKQKKLVNKYKTIKIESIIDIKS